MTLTFACEHLTLGGAVIARYVVHGEDRGLLCERCFRSLPKAWRSPKA